MAKNSPKNAEFEPYDATRNGRSVEYEPALEETVSPKKGDVTRRALLLGWTEGKAVLLPGFYRVFGNLDRCLEPV